MSQETTSVSNDIPGTQVLPGRIVDTVICFSLALILFLLFLGHRPLEDWDEAIYADIARQFVHGTSHLIPYWNFQPWLERTPLFEWLTAAFFAVFGTSEFWARAGAALSGAGTVVIIFQFAREWMGRSAAWLAAGTLITTPQFFWQSRFGTTDSMLTLWMIVSLYGLYRVIKDRPAGWYLVWVGLGLGIMTKSAGPAPFVLTGMVVLWINRHTVRFGRDFYAAFSLMLAIVIPWHLYMWAHFGNRFIDDYIGRQILVRSTKSLEGHTGTPFFYVIRIAKGGFPWSLLLIPIVVRVFRTRRLNVVEIYATVIFLFYTLVKTKLPWYITPFYPALALLAVREMKPWITRHASVRRLKRFSVPVFTVLSVILLYGDVSHPYDRPEVLLLKEYPMPELQGPLILCSDELILDSPAPVYYSNRRVVQAFVNQVPRQVENGAPFDPATNDPKFRDPRQLSRYVSSGPQLILLDRALQQQVASQYTLRVIASNANYVLGAISRHS